MACGARGLCVWCAWFSCVLSVARVCGLLVYTGGFRVFMYVCVFVRGVGLRAPRGAHPVSATPSLVPAAALKQLLRDCYRSSRHI